jgi:hypothetical protein
VKYFEPFSVWHFSVWQGERLEVWARRVADHINFWFGWLKAWVPQTEKRSGDCLFHAACEHANRLLRRRVTINDIRCTLIQVCSGKKPLTVEATKALDKAVGVESFFASYIVEAYRSYAQQLDRHERQMSGRSEAGRVSSYSNGGAGRESEEDRQARYDMMSSLGDIGGATFPQQPPVVAPLGRTVTQNVGMLALLPPPVPDLASSLGMSIHSLYQGRRAPRYCQQCHKPMQGHPRGRCESDGQG